jgi:hypothetical protein
LRPKILNGAAMEGRREREREHGQENDGNAKDGVKVSVPSLPSLETCPLSEVALSLLGIRYGKNWVSS